MYEKIRWGILGTGNIAFKFRNGLRSIPDAEAAALCSRSEEKAARLAEQHNIKKAYGNFDDMLADKNIDAIYVAAPHSLHLEYSLRAVESGKPVLCEKPFTINAGQAKTLIDAAAKKKVFLMEAMWTRFLPAIVKARSWIKEGRIGEVCMAQANFGYILSVTDPGHRMLNPGLGGGALLDIGVYSISFLSMIMGTVPGEIKSFVSYGRTGVDEEYTIQMDYGNNKKGSICGSLRSPLDNDALIFGTRGSIRVPRFFAAKSAQLILPDGNSELFDGDYSAAGNGYNYEAMEAAACIRQGLTQSQIMPLQETLEIMRTMDRVREQWNLVFPCEKP